MHGLEQTLVQISEDEGQTLLSNLLEHSGTSSLSWYVRSLVGMDRIAAQAAFGQFLNDRSLAAAQIRFVEMVIDQLTARGIMDASALYDPPFSNLHNRGPDVLFVSKENVIDGSFGTLAEVHSELNVHEGQREQYGLPKYWTADGSPEFRCTLIGPDCWFVFCST